MKLLNVVYPHVEKLDRKSSSFAMLTMTPLNSWKRITRFTVRTSYCNITDISYFHCRIHYISSRMGTNDTNPMEQCKRWVILCVSWSINPFIYVCSAEFITENPELVSPDNSMGFLSNDNGQHYNLCHCKTRLVLKLIYADLGDYAVWSNFEIADMDFWRGEAYQKFFEFLDSKGGFYYEVGLRSSLEYTRNSTEPNTEMG